MPPLPKLTKCPQCLKTKKIRPDRTYCSVACSAAARAEARTWEKTVVFGDVHIPFQDDVALNLVTEFIARENPDRIIINGDFADCYDVSSFSKDPLRKASFPDEVLLVREKLGEIRNAAPRAEIIYLSGNHEHRLHKYIIDNAKALRGLDGMTIEEQFHLRQMDIKWIPCRADRFTDTFVEVGQSLLVGHFAMVRAHSGYTAKNLLDRYGKSLIQGHVHSVGSSNKTLANGQIMGWEGGCLCGLEPHYCRPFKWCHAFHVVHSRPDGEFFHVEPVLIINGSYFYGGKMHKAI